jgi:hypothetical protein
MEYIYVSQDRNIAPRLEFTYRLLIGNALLSRIRVFAAMTMKEDILKQLLEELLSSADESGPIGHGASPDDLDINRQVIELVVNAGLMVLTQRPISGILASGTF